MTGHHGRIVLRSLHQQPNPTSDARRNNVAIELIFCVIVQVMTKVKESIRTHRSARRRKPSKGQRVGYLRVSALDQNEVRQLEGLVLNKTLLTKPPART
jgi:hypothetical protein